ncbi:MAG: Crp/Fnr family transcriptional regulator [Paracoccaceae bacterium]|nr:Crp/Fnr family transcriptional regulator [Paracoccaceae bacterium]
MKSKVKFNTSVFSAPWLDGMPTEAIAQLRSTSLPFALSSGRRLTAIGDTADCLIALRDGFVGIHTDDEEHHDVIAHIFGPGDWFGVAAILFDGARIIGSSALSDVQGLKIPKSAIERVAEVHPTLWRGIAILAVAGTQIAISSGREKMIKSPTDRCAATFVRLVGRQPLPCRLPITQNQLAEICGLSRGAVAKALSVLEDKGVIKRGYSSISVLKT